MTLLLIPLAVFADEALRYLLHHRTGLTAALVAVLRATPGHGRRSRPVSWPHPLRQRHRGTRIAPRPAREAATA